jgi:prolyl-tRNA editing enzyme YbaK/EbsC (Cys-tRNA(Pro) deacylase)
MSQEHTPLPRAARRVAEALRSRGHEGEIRLLDESARSAAEAAAALGVSQQQIVKSLVFRARRSDQPILALVGGTSRVDAQLLADHVGEPVDRAEADWVREQTGFSIGGVPPVGHSERLRTIADTALVECSQLWAAAGTPHAVFPLRGDQLARLTGAELAPISSSAAS